MPHLIKDVCKKPITNGILNNERLDAFLPKTRITVSLGLLLTFLFNIVLEVLAIAKKEIKVCRLERKK